MDRLTSALAAFCLAALGVLAVEWAPDELAPPGIPAAPALALAMPVRHPDSAAFVRVILARPLMSATRRPPAAAAGAPARGQGAAPRLSGTLISPHGRVAVFKLPAGPAVSRLQGQAIGRYVVEAVHPGWATLWDGTRHVRLTVRPDAASGGFVSSIDTAIVAYPDNTPALRQANRTVDGQREE